jgi:integrase
MGAAEISSLTLEAFNEGYDPETGITMLDMRRVKVDRDFITFLSPEASAAVHEYLKYRDRPTRTGRQVEKDIRDKQKTTPGSYLFITDHVPAEYLTEHDEEMRRLSPEAILKLYRRISDRAGMDSAKNVYNMIRSHNMRKWFNSTLKHQGCDSDTVEFFMGHTLGDTKEAYMDYDIDAGRESLKATYAKFVPYLTIKKELDVAASEEYKKIVKENTVLQAETVRHMVERSEIASVKAELERLLNTAAA